MLVLIPLLVIISFLLAQHYYQYIYDFNIEDQLLYSKLFPH